MPNPCHNIVFQASAGTGKTYNVVNLYVALVLGDRCCAPGTETELCAADPDGHGLDPERLLLMTFTENAAAELRLRAAQFLDERLAALIADPDADPDGEPALRKRMRQLAAAPVCTIHSFCARFLRKHALQAGLSPRFRVIEGDELEELQRDTYYETVTAAVANNAYLEGLHSLLGSTRFLEQCKEFVARLEELRLDVHSDGPVADLIRLTRPPVDDLLEPWLALPAGGRRGGIMQLLGTRDPDTVRNLGETGLEALASDLLAAQRSSTVPAIAQIRDWAKRTVAAARGRPYFTAFLELAGACQQSYRTAKQSRNAVDFQDLIVRTVRLLTDCPELAFPQTADGVQALFDVIIVDEVQDNSRLQYELLRALWRPQQNRLVICGDTKQSIYIWRDADSQVMPDLATDMEGTADDDDPVPVSLRTSYRSQAALIDAINELAQCIYALQRPDDAGTSRDGQDWTYAAEALMPREPQPQPARPNLELLLPDWQVLPHPDAAPAWTQDTESPVPWEDLASPQAGSDSTTLPFLRSIRDVTSDTALADAWAKAAASPISEEALAVARRIKLLVDGTPAWRPDRIFDGTGWAATAQAQHALAYRDVLVLLRRTTHQTIFEEALRLFGIPYSISGKGRGFFQRPEVRDLCNLLRVLLNPADTVALLAVLRSPFVGLSDAAILLLSAEADARPSAATLGRRLLPPPLPPGDGTRRTPECPPEVDIPDLPPADRARLRRGLKLLASGRELAGRERVVATLRTAIRASGFDAVQAGSPRGGARLANIRKLLDWLADHEREGVNTLSDMVRLLNARIEGETAEPEAPIHDPGENAVHIMTVHAAKGLTQRIVFLPDLRGRLGEPAKCVFAPDGRKLEFRLPVPGRDGEPLTAATDRYDTCAEQARDEHWREAQNLLYVAITRARDLVVLSGDHGRGKGDSLACWRNWLNQYLLTSREHNHPPRLAVRTYGQLAQALARPWHARAPDTPDAEALTAASRLPARQSAPDRVLTVPVTRLCQALLDSHNGQRVEALAALVRGEPLFGHGQAHAAQPHHATDEPQVEQDTSVPTIDDRIDDDAMGQEFGQLALGTLGHLVLEQIDWAQPAWPQTEQLAELLAGSPPEAERVCARLHHALGPQTELVNRLATARQIAREVPFAMALRLPAITLVVNGAVDLIFQDDDGWYLLDYKFTDTDDDAALRQRYALQLAIYREAMTRLERPPRTAAFWVMGSHTARLLPIANSELDDVLTGAVEALQDLAGSDPHCGKSPHKPR